MNSGDYSSRLVGEYILGIKQLEFKNIKSFLAFYLLTIFSFSIQYLQILICPTYYVNF